MAYHKILEEYFDLGGSPTLGDGLGNWSTIRPRDVDSQQSEHKSTEAIQKPIVISSSQHRRFRVKETEVAWWLGTVTEVSDGFFTGRLEDLSGQVSIVEFENDTISHEEQSLLCEGAIFTYAISAIDNPLSRSGGREYKTKLAFSGKKRWLDSYREKTKKLVDSVFPEDWLE